MNSSFAIRGFRGALAVSTLFTAQFAFAHAMPKQESPAPDSAVASPAEVSIDFGEALEPTFSTLVVLDASGKQVNTAHSAVDANNKKHMSVALDGLAPGAYQVKWAAVADDGHRTQGHYNFKVK